MAPTALSFIIMANLLLGSAPFSYLFSLITNPQDHKFVYRTLEFILAKIPYLRWTTLYSETWLPRSKYEMKHPVYLNFLFCH